MIIRERATVIQLYRAEYERDTKRSKTTYIGAFAKFGEPTTELLAKLKGMEGQQLESFLAARAITHEAILGRALFAGAPAELRRIAMWLRRQEKSPEILRGAKQLRDAYADLYAVMRTLGVARLRGASARSATRAARAATPVPLQDPAATTGAAAGATQGPAADLPTQS